MLSDEDLLLVLLVDLEILEQGLWALIYDAGRATCRSEASSNF